MKVVLTKDVRNMGRSGSVIEVSDGHAINFLFPRQLAKPATAQAIKESSLRVQQTEDRKVLDAGLLAQGIESLNASKVVIPMKANEKGHLYEAVGAAEIVAAAQAQAGVELPEETIKLEKPFKEVGTYEVTVSAGSHTGTFSISIEAE